MSESYEQQLELVQQLRRPASNDDRHITWISGGNVIGLARTPTGRLEIFLSGAPLVARFRRVRGALEYQTWFRAGGEELLANRILLPAAGHFEQVAAFLSTELVRNGARTDLPRAFAETEPLIEMAIEDLLLADEAFVGLCGEMLLLGALLVLASDGRVGAIIETWKGHRETARDFQLGQVGVEVKTTTRKTSSHLFRGVHQLESGHGVDEADETSYILASIGLEWTEAGDEANTTSLPELVDRCVARLSGALGPPAATPVAQLLTDILAYGPPTTLGYDHTTMQESARFTHRFRVTFVRGYDMADEAIRLLTTDDLRARPFIETESLRMRVNLPDNVRGDVNPVAGLNACAQWLLAIS
jgi:Putative  PD-(D/E)XK family member, (DUF4420)